MSPSYQHRNESVTEVPLKCSCGAVQGVASSVTAKSGNRVVCCCDDCQLFARYLDREDVMLDKYGGTDIFQMPISHVSIIQGAEKIRCVRLSRKGMFRWYVECCKTPIGNTMSAGVPLIGVIHNFMDDTSNREKNIGPVLGYTQTKFAKKALPPDRNQSTFPIGLILRFLSKVILWKLKGLNRPSPFFSSSGSPVSEPHILSSNTGK